VGQHQMFAALYYPYAKPRRGLNSGGLGTMALVACHGLFSFGASRCGFLVVVTGDGKYSDDISRVINLVSIWFAYKDYFIEQPSGAWYGSQWADI